MKKIISLFLSVLMVVTMFPLSVFAEEIVELEEIKVISPKVVVTLGNVPLKAVTGEKKAVIGDYHGKPTPMADGRTLFALYHPAAVIYNRALQATYDEDLLELKAFLQKEGLA